ncbi:pyrroline-5-carboxylate reductase [Karstenula rhodostoma CBS 690.94]|uniref:Pyrroline-5-carboxylate reductase n=1 Tax=Karstenula rhodostoma CBS 690.94 TaxID=1392251 RepID=A0A9P4U845_9PLEO|nr:pyrroline-5-carboxylate reductase [Karstenula rhodostoma CBS 690.94]
MATWIVKNMLRNTSEASRVSKILASVRTERSADRLRHELRDHSKRIDIRVQDNVGVASASDMIMLACKPYQVQKLLAAQGLAEALHTKGIISILAGITPRQIRETLTKDRADGNYDIIRAGPNVGARVGECMTVISEPHDVSTKLVEDTTWLFEQIGRVTEVVETAYDSAFVMVGSAYSLPTVAIEGLIDGAVQQGLSRAAATDITVQCLKGLTKMLENGDQAADIRNSICTPNSVTIAGYLELERRAVRAAFADSLRVAIERTKSYGKK